MKKIIIALITLLFLASCWKDKESPQMPLGYIAPEVLESMRSGEKAPAPEVLPDPAPPTETGASLQVTPAIELPPVDVSKLKGTKELKEKLKEMQLAKDEFKTVKSDRLTVNGIEDGAKVDQELHITGKVPISWLSQGMFPIKVMDESNGIVGEGYGKTDVGASSTGSIADFTFDISLSIPMLAKKGFLRLYSANPSGLPENNDSASIKVVFN